MQIVEEDRDRVLACRKRAQEFLKCQRESILRFGRPELRYARLRPDDELELGDDIDEDSAVRADATEEAALPARERLPRRREHVAHDLAKCLPEGCIRNTSTERFELAFDEIP